jgi:hypothetical protein
VEITIVGNSNSAEAKKEHVIELGAGTWFLWQIGGDAFGKPQE